jgi:hypothetical protein
MEPQNQGATPMEPAVQRAEELVDAWGQKIGNFAARLLARTREEAEDIWAEAQSIRHNTWAK